MFTGKAKHLTGTMMYIHSATHLSLMLTPPALAIYTEEAVNLQYVEEQVTSVTQSCVPVISEDVCTVEGFGYQAPPKAIVHEYR